MIGKTLVLIAAALGGACLASATTIETATGNQGEVGDPFRACLVTNGSAQEIDVTVSLVDQAGVVQNTSVLTVPPGGIGVPPTYLTGYDLPQSYCRVEGSFPRNQVRAIYCSVEINYLDCYHAVHSR